MRKRHSPRPVKPLLAILIGFLFLVAAGAFLKERNVQILAITETPSGNPLDAIERVNVQDAFQAFQNQQAIFLDVRTQSSYMQDHIPGSVNIPLSELQSRSHELNPSRWIITYCT